MYVYCNIKVCSCNHCCGGKTVSITQSECVFVALGAQHEMHMCHIVICGLSDYTVFSTCLGNGMFKKKKLLNTKCVFRFSLQLLPETFLILRTEQASIINIYWPSCKVQVILAMFS